MCNIEKEHVFGCMGVICIAFIFSYLIVLGVQRIIEQCNTNTTPVESINNIDSIQQVNRTIIIEVEHLDSAKNEKIIKVKELDNDSTLKLFYQLIRE